MVEEKLSSMVVLNGVKGQTSVIVQSDPSISIKGHCCWVKGRSNNGTRGFKQAPRT